MPLTIQGRSTRSARRRRQNSTTRTSFRLKEASTMRKLRMPSARLAAWSSARQASRLRGRQTEPVLRQQKEQRWGQPREVSSM